MQNAHTQPSSQTDLTQTGRLSDADMIRRLRLLASLERYSSGPAKVVFSARVALVVRAIARGAQ